MVASGSRDARRAVATDTSTHEDTRELLRSRLSTCVGVMFAIRLVVIAVVVGAHGVYGLESRWMNRSSWVSTIAATAGLGVLFWFLKKARPSLGVLRGIDALVTVALAAAAAHAISFDVASEFAARPDLLLGTLDSHELKALLVLAHLLLLRAAIIPSHPARTAVLGALAGAAICAGTWHAYSAIGALPVSRSRPLVNALVWSSFSVLISVVCSHAIYGLRRQVRDARRLGQYTLAHKLGAGGMGVVYHASHALLRRPTAVKVLATDRMGTAALERFEREVQLTARLSHPNIVSVYDFGRASDGTFYYAMEYLDGVDLQALVDDEGPLPAGRVLRILRQGAEALAEAHAVQLIHRDIKPANMILTRRASEADVVKVVDFGLVKDLATRAAPELSGTHELRGTPLYMAPEAVVAPDRVGPESDMYALGAVGYFLITGRPVFDGQTAVAVLGHHAHTRPVPPSDRADDVPPKLEAVVLRCLEKEPERRFASARELVAALDACDDVVEWTQSRALAWWQARGGSAKSSRAPALGSTLAVDWDERAAG